jgi:Family of unknown function (DUF6011)
LSADPERRREIRYVGLYVVWWDDGNWEWIKCVNCGAELTSPTSRERGCGPTCAEVVTEAAKQARLREERINARAYLEEKKRPRRRRRAAPTRSGAGTPTNVDGHPGPSRGKSKPKGITNEQAKELARLQRAAGEPYSGSGMTEREARAQIQRLTC